VPTPPQPDDFNQGLHSTQERGHRFGLPLLTLFGLSLVVFVTLGETLELESVALLGVGLVCCILGAFLIWVKKPEDEEGDERESREERSDDEVSEYLRSPDFDDFDTWSARLTLRVLLEDALADPDVLEVLADEQLQRQAVQLSLLANDSLTGRIRIEQDRLIRADEHRSRPAVRPGHLPPGQYIWLAIVVVVDIGYLSLLRAAWPRLPLPLHVVAVAGLIAVAALSARTIVLRAPDVFGVTSDRAATEPHPDLLRIGDRREYLLVEIVVPAVHEFVRAHRSVRFGTKLVRADVSGLDEADGGETVMTAGAERLRRIIERAGSGAVALAGSRGVGKTTAITAVRQGRMSTGGSPPLVVMASAPANYEARDFVLHLHALLCRTVIDKTTEALEPLLPEGPDERGAAVRRGIVKLVRFFVFALVCLGAAFLLWGASLPNALNEVRSLATSAIADLPSSAKVLWTAQPFAHRAALGLVGLVAWRIVWALVVAPIKLLVLLGRRRLRSELFELRKSALQQLTETRFLQTHTSGWSGKLSLPLKGEAGRTWSTQRAEQQLTHPEVVEKLRSFAGESSQTLRENGVIDRMVIAIDELDKIGEPEKAQQFINDIKGVFGVPGCLFFVSVSDDAVLNFEQRGLGIRDAFDSAFSELVRLENFTLDESRQWMASRVAGITEQFCYLNHCLSGGLPRDLQRYTVEVIDVAARVHEPSLATVTEILVRKDLASKVHALIGLMSTFDAAPEHVTFTAKLLTIRDTDNPLELARLAEDLIRESAEDSVKQTDLLRWNAACSTMFCATLLEIFSDDLSKEALTEEFHELALARQQMQAQPHLAWQRIIDFRKARDLSSGVGTET
jgi:hypothetical protein